MDRVSPPQRHAPRTRSHAQRDKTQRRSLSLLRNPVPASALANLEARFHNLIRQEAGLLLDTSGLYLPLLESFMDGDPVWFPLRCGVEGAGYLFWLDGRDLVVRSRGLGASGGESVFVVTEREVFSVEGGDD